MYVLVLPIAMDWQTVLPPIHRVLPSHGLVGHTPIRTTLNILLSRTLTHHVYKHMSTAGRMAIRQESATPAQVSRFSPLQPKCPGARDGDSHVKTTSIMILITIIKASAFPEKECMIKESIQKSIFQKYIWEHSEICLDCLFLSVGPTTDIAAGQSTEMTAHTSHATCSMYCPGCRSRSILSGCVAGQSGIQCKHRKYVVNQGWDELHLGQPTLAWLFFVCV